MNNFEKIWTGKWGRMTNKINGIDVSESVSTATNNDIYYSQKAVDELENKIKRLQEENKRLQMLSCANCGEKYLSPDGVELYEKNVQLQEENEKLKEKIKSEKYIKENALQEATKYSMKCGEFRQALKEIKEIIEMPKYTCKEFLYIRGKINEVLKQWYSFLLFI